jgi:hypothetical protein
MMPSTWSDCASRSSNFCQVAVAEANHDYNLPRLRGDPEFADYRKEPRFQAILQRLH